MDHFEDIQCTPVIPRKVEERSVSLPAYIVSRMPIKDYLILTKTTLASIKEPCLKIMDFGNCESSQKRSQHHTEVIQHLELKTQGHRPTLPSVFVHPK